MRNYLFEAIKNPLRILRFIVHRTAPLWSDRLYLKLYYYACMGHKLNLDYPQRFTEKIQWLKLNDRHTEYTMLVDKYAVKEYLKKIGYSEMIIPTLGVWDSAEDIDFEALPQQFVLKCTHDSGGIVVCKDKSKLDIDAARKNLKEGLKRNFYFTTREYPYRDVKPRIIAERYIEDESGYELKDYKIFCFNGTPKFLFVATDRGVKGVDVKFDFFDLNWKHFPFYNGHDHNSNIPVKQKNFDKMLAIAADLSQGFPHVRIDLYNCDGKIYLGEYTFFHFGGFTAFKPDEWDYKLGEYLQLPIK